MIDAKPRACHPRALDRPARGRHKSRGPDRGFMTDLFETIRRVLVPIHKEGYPFIAIGIVLTVKG